MSRKDLTPVDGSAQPADQRGENVPSGRGLHVAIIMDGNGRWAQRRGMPRVAGHRAGVKAVRRAVEAAVKLELKTLTLYAFSSDNWKRPPAEVSTLFGLLRRYLRSETARCVREGVRIRMVGRRDRLDPSLVRQIERSEQETAGGSVLDVRMAVDYSARDAILRATELCDGQPIDRETFAERMAQANCAPDSPDVDLLLRTGGEKRLSDFLLWECAYAELEFLDVMWPDFGEQDLIHALRDFQGRERRFGRVEEQTATG